MAVIELRIKRLRTGCSTLEAVELMAIREGRSMANLVEWLLSTHPKLMTNPISTFTGGANGEAND